MPLILRAVKGSKLSILEMDGNLTYLSSTLSGSIIQVTGSSIDASNTSITASFFIGNGSQLTFVTASFVTASNVFGPHGASSILSSSYAISASQAVSSSFALTASYVNPLRQDVQITGSLFVSNSIDTENAELINSAGFISVQWEDGTLRDSVEALSIDWNNRLFYVAGDEFISWDGGFGPVETQDDLINLGTDNSRWRNGYVSRTFVVGNPSGVNTTISAFSPDGVNSVGGITMTTGSTAPTNPTNEGSMFVGKVGANYYINVFIGGRWRSSSLS
jgi:hypothetical protein